MKVADITDHMSKNTASLEHSLSGVIFLALYHSLSLWDAPFTKSQSTLIITILQKHSSNLSLCRSGISIIHSLSESPETLPHVATPESISSLTVLLRTHYLYEDIATLLCTTISSLVFAVEPLQPVLLKCGGPDVLLQTLSAHPGNDQICKSVCDVLVYLSSAPGVSGAMSGCIPGITAALGTLVGDPATCGCLCEMLCHILEGVYEKVKGEKELVGALLEVVRMYQNDVVVSGLACQVLGLIVQLSEDGLSYVWGLVENDPVLSKFIGNIF